MDWYLYRCTSCGQYFVVRTWHADDEQVVCTACGHIMNYPHCLGTVGGMPEEGEGRADMAEERLDQLLDLLNDAIKTSHYTLEGIYMLKFTPEAFRGLCETTTELRRRGGTQG